MQIQNSSYNTELFKWGTHFPALSKMTQFISYGGIILAEDVGDGYSSLFPNQSAQETDWRDFSSILDYVVGYPSQLFTTSLSELIVGGFPLKGKASDTQRVETHRLIAFIPVLLLLVVMHYAFAFGYSLIYWNTN